MASYICPTCGFCKHEDHKCPSCRKSWLEVVDDDFLGTSKLDLLLLLQEANNVIRASGLDKGLGRIVSEKIIALTSKGKIECSRCKDYFDKDVMICVTSHPEVHDGMYCKNCFDEIKEISKGPWQQL